MNTYPTTMVFIPTCDFHHHLTFTFFLVLFHVKVTFSDTFFSTQICLGLIQGGSVAELKTGKCFVYVDWSHRKLFLNKIT